MKTQGNPRAPGDLDGMLPGKNSDDKVNHFMAQFGLVTAGAKMPVVLIKGLCRVGFSMIGIPCRKKEVKKERKKERKRKESKL